jgi:hypothetical protein
MSKRHDQDGLSLNIAFFDAALKQGKYQDETTTRYEINRYTIIIRIPASSIKDFLFSRLSTESIATLSQLSEAIILSNNS